MLKEEKYILINDINEYKSEANNKKNLILRKQKNRSFYHKIDRGFINK